MAQVHDPLIYWIVSCTRVYPFSRLCCWWLVMISQVAPAAVPVAFQLHRFAECYSPSSCLWLFMGMITRCVCVCVYVGWGLAEALDFARSGVSNSVMKSSKYWCDYVKSILSNDRQRHKIYCRINRDVHNKHWRKETRLTHRQHRQIKRKGKKFINSYLRFKWCKNIDYTVISLICADSHEIVFSFNDE